MVTPGLVDHRLQLPLYHLPESLQGLRCLAVGWMDNFWASEMERRGAAEVVAIDQARHPDLPYGVREEWTWTGQDRPKGADFGLAHEAGSPKVKKQTISVYDLSPELLGEFDFIFLGDLLLHLRDPQLALQRIRSVCRGVVYVAEVWHPDLESFGDVCLAEYPIWVQGESVRWRMNVNTIKRMILVAGFDTVEQLSRFRLEAPGAPAGCLTGTVVLQGTLAREHAHESPLQELVETR